MKRLATAANIDSLGSVALTAARGFFVVFCLDIISFVTAPEPSRCLITRGAIRYFEASKEFFTKKEVVV